MTAVFERLPIRSQSPMLHSHLSPPHIEPERNVVFQMASIISKLEQDLRNLSLRKLDLTYAHFRVLQYLLEDDGRPIGEIARATAVRPSVLSRVVDQMEERELVRRQADTEDSRSTRVYLTDHGREKYALAWPTAHRLIQYALEVLEPEECEQLQALMKKINQHVCPG